MMVAFETSGGVVKGLKVESVRLTDLLLEGNERRIEFAL
jgi:hypothetical protein